MTFGVPAGRYNDLPTGDPPLFSFLLEGDRASVQDNGHQDIISCGPLQAGNRPVANILGVMFSEELGEGGVRDVAENLDPIFEIRPPADASLEDDPDDKNPLPVTRQLNDVELHHVLRTGRVELVEVRFHLNKTLERLFGTDEVAVFEHVRYGLNHFPLPVAWPRLLDGLD